MIDLETIRAIVLIIAFVLMVLGIVLSQHPPGEED